MRAALVLPLLLACGTDADDSGASRADDSGSPRTPTDYSQPGAAAPGTLQGTVAGSTGTDLPVQVWYPAEPSDQTPITYDGFYAGGAFEGATAACDGPRPVLVFSHGNSGVRWQSPFFTEYLASHGWVVVAPDHVGNTLFDMGDVPFDEVILRRPVAGQLPARRRVNQRTARWRAAWTRLQATPWPGTASAASRPTPRLAPLRAPHPVQKTAPTAGCGPPSWPPGTWAASSTRAWPISVPVSPWGRLDHHPLELIEADTLTATPRFSGVPRGRTLQLRAGELSGPRRRRVWRRVCGPRDLHHPRQRLVARLPRGRTGRRGGPRRPSRRPRLAVDRRALSGSLRGCPGSACPPRPSRRRGPDETLSSMAAVLGRHLRATASAPRFSSSGGAWWRRGAPCSRWGS